MLSVIHYIKSMRDEKYFLHPVHDWQKRYEALRASFGDRLPAEVVADRFGYSQSYVNLLRHQFVHEKSTFQNRSPKARSNGEK